MEKTRIATPAPQSAHEARAARGTGQKPGSAEDAAIAAGQGGGFALLLAALGGGASEQASTQAGEQAGEQVGAGCSRGPADDVELRRSREVEVRVLNPLGTVGHVRPNSLQPPFDRAEARQALLALLDQAEFIAATTPDSSLGRECHSLFTCGTPLESDAGIAEWSRPDPERARRLLAASGYRGEPIVLLDPADQPAIHAIALVTADALRRIGANVQVETMDWSTLVTRRNSKGPTGPGLPGWNLAFTTWGGFTFASVLTNTPLVSSCDGRNLYGWPCDEELERLRAAYFRATTPDAGRAAADALQRRYFQVVPYVNTGIFQQASAWRRDLAGIRPTFYPVAWNVERRRR